MMITLTIVETKKKGSVMVQRKSLKMYGSMDKAKREIMPIVREMKSAKRQGKAPSVMIKAVSYETKSEYSMLLEAGAIVSVDNESGDGE